MARYKSPITTDHLMMMKRRKQAQNYGIERSDHKKLIDVNYLKKK